jgi:hypothetical protein
VSHRIEVHGHDDKSNSQPKAHQIALRRALAVADEIVRLGVPPEFITVIGFALFMAFPIVMSLLLSLAKWRGVSTLDTATFVGGANYLQLLAHDPRFATSLKVTLYYTLIAVPGGQALALLAAVLMNQKVRGIKISMLDDALEVRLRRELLPHDQIVLTGDDFHFGRMILGGDPQATPSPVPPTIQRWTEIAGRKVALGDFSHALLGVFDAIAEPAGLALQALARNDAAKFLDLMDPCETLGRHVFCAPTQHYKAGLAFLAFANGRQDNAMLVRREDRARDAGHYRRCAELAVLCSALRDDETTTARVESLLQGGPQ